MTPPADISHDPNPDYPTHMFTDPSDYFRGGSSQSCLFKPLFYGGMGSIGFGSAVLFNYLTRRPVYSGIQRHIAATGAFLAAAYYFDKTRRRRHIEKDSVIRHYIETHPDDFPPIVRQQYKDILRPWIPIR